MEKIGNDIINPALILAISRMRENDNPTTRGKMLQEATRARFLVPCEMKFALGTEGDPRRTPDNTIVNFNMLKTTEGILYFMAFTDMDELKKWKNENGQNVFILRFDDLAKMIMKPNCEAEGFVLNPSSTNLLFRKNIIADAAANQEETDENAENVKDGAEADAIQAENDETEKGDN